MRLIIILFFPCERIIEFNVGTGINVCFQFLLIRNSSLNLIYSNGSPFAVDRAALNIFRTYKTKIALNI